MRVHHYPLKAGITRTPEFEKKGLATRAVNIGTKCGHGCLYCSTGAVLRMHGSFRDCGEDPFAYGYAIVDPSTSERVARDAKRAQKRGLVQLCTLTDASARRHRNIDLAAAASMPSCRNQVGPSVFSRRTKRSGTISISSRNTGTAFSSA